MIEPRADARAEATVRLARLGGRMAVAMFRETTVSWKSDGSMLTDADVRIQRRLETEIAALFPDDGLLGEEETGAAGAGLDARHCWVLDPIDGTNNFGRRMPGFTVSVGVLRDGVPWAGAVYDPVADHLFSARRGAGAWLNGERLAVGPAPLSSHSLFSIRSPFDDAVPEFAQGWLCRYRLRRFGSTALHLCYVATGGLAFVHDHRASLWDVAGAGLVLTEAGGIITHDDGSPLFPVAVTRVREALSFVAGDPEAHRAALGDLERDATSPPRGRASARLARPGHRRRRDTA